MWHCNPNKSALHFSSFFTSFRIFSYNPDVVINVVDASVLECNLFFTLQLIEVEAFV
ncbi:MAG: FeoB small GTPase domain-containing protein [Candidatus Bathyarchaeota archaeon]